MALKTPILLITFNRPDHTRLVLERIFEAQPTDLYIFQDGARSLSPQPLSPAGKGTKTEHPDIEKCQQVRNVIEELTGAKITTGKSTIHCTPYTIHFYGSSTNLGCGPGPMTALNWFFSENEMGIILEDDAVPHPDFFPYAEELLEMYKDDTSVRAIGSMNIDSHRWGDGSYYFSMMNRNLCAWATWRRAWPKIDLKLPSISRTMLNTVLKRYGCGIKEREYWCDILDSIHKDGAGGASWDMQFCISIWLDGAKGIIPNVNISSNIGFDEQATHGTNSQDLLANNKVLPIMPLKHPLDLSIQAQADREYHRRYFQPFEYGWNGLKRLPYRINKRLKRLCGHEGSWIK